MEVIKGTHARLAKMGRLEAKLLKIGEAQRLLQEVLIEEGDDQYIYNTLSTFESIVLDYQERVKAIQHAQEVAYRQANPTDTDTAGGLSA